MPTIVAIHSLSKVIPDYLKGIAVKLNKVHVWLKPAAPLPGF